MAFEAVSVNNTYGHTSQSATAAAHNIYDDRQTTLANGTVQVGVIKSLPVRGVTCFCVAAAAAFGSGESLVVNVQTLDAGVAATKATITLDENNVTAAGDYEFSLSTSLSTLAPGKIVLLNYVYTAGTPNDPDLSLVLQIG